MNIKRPLLIIIPLLLLILLLFFICSDRETLFKDDNSGTSISDSDGIGYMREISPGEDMDDTAGDNIRSARSIDVSGSESQESRSSVAGGEKTSGTSVNKENDGREKPASEKRTIPAKRDTAAEKSRSADTETAARRVDRTVGEKESEDERTAADIAENKEDAGKEVSAAESSGADEDIIDDKSTSPEEKDIAEKKESPVMSDADKDAGGEDVSIAEEKIEAGDSKDDAVSAGDKSEADKVITDKSKSREAVFSRLDRIYLYSGEILTGTVTERGDVYTIVTSEGIRKIAAHDIQSNDIVK